MLPSVSLQQLYTLAIAEGGGVGLAYAYYARRLLLAAWLQRRGFRPNSPQPPRVLIAGLPETVGSSLDLLLISAELGATPLVIDDRPAALERLTQSLATAQRLGQLQDVRFKGVIVNDMGVIWEAAADFDLILSSDVIQRLDKTTQSLYISHLQQIGKQFALFGPNGNNPVYLADRATTGVTLDQLRTMSAPNAYQFGYLALPPFGSTVSLSRLIADNKISNRLQAIMFAALQISAWVERFLPNDMRFPRARLVYQLSLASSDANPTKVIS